MSGQFRVGIVGCGNISDNHFQSYSSLADVEVIGVCDVDLARAREFASDRGIAHAVGSVQELIALGIDALSVCTPHPTHEAVVTKAAEAGVHVLCEKPIATDVASAERMVQAAEHNDVTLGVVFQRRFWPGAQALRAAIDDGRLGQPMLGHCQVLLHRGTDYYDASEWRGTWAADGGGVLMTQAIHNIDLLQWFMGDPVEVSAKAGAFVLGDSIEVEDTAAALITFASGAIATLAATVAASPNLGTRIIVTGSNGATVNVTEYPEGSDAVNDLWAVPGEECAAAVFADGLSGDIPVAEVNARLLPLHKLQVADFVDAVRTRRAPAVSGQEAMKSLQIVAAIYESARTGLPVKIGTADELSRQFAHLESRAVEPAGSR
ncbi:UDP-N-acetyl-2-amino-2-deoxyglucuronate dehydrogenase [Arthrobacter sp. B3I9]|uniref:Gfo/Idh/MocA family protein n=1 Tax=Arthrobacter sp. B3I9 TaxID=3042270 RepID=UPI002792DD38|nr:Gfo/Idh/MocA family oxidoreductase [Arthrobacter sp. B3I9]MDQ0851330.1 UDP-N-acetyl-2-amino-2-deoxyglucuronate dehydrogenase [Arthrobacter sp. B3I9]